MMSMNYYKRNSVINLNVDDELIQPHIIKAQNMNMERILGTNLFNKVLTDISSGSVSGDTKTLLEDYIQPALVEWTTYQALPYLNYKITNKSVSKKFSDNSDYSELNEINYLKTNIRNDAEYLSDRLTSFLKADNGLLYPEYIKGNVDCDDITPKRKNFFSGIYLTGNDDYDCKYC